MLTERIYDFENGLITFTQGVKGTALDEYCKLEGIDYQHIVSENRMSRLQSLIRKRQQKVRHAYTS
jgi:hypothetical protein